MAQIICNRCGTPIPRVPGEYECGACSLRRIREADIQRQLAAAEERARGVFVSQFVLNAASSGHIGDTGFVIRQAEHAWQQLREKYPFGE